MRMCNREQEEGKNRIKLKFCEECHHLDIGGGIIEGPLYDCTAPENCRKRHNWLWKWLVPQKKPKKLNKNNDCEWWAAKR
ncbi:hypothetical protein LCGC14_1753560 [marine sediment metagenome]|uniref:Uncharacterized protein n=1 Tax=marine sediment metagenome TaxID=412755 RepID=A0A0F9JIB2_9ZZZZ